MCDMDVIRLCGPANILQAPANCIPYLSTSEQDLNRSYFSANNINYTDDDGEELCQIPSSKSLDSLNTLLDKLPDIVIPEPVYNPLPLQCLAANSLPESVRSEIDAVLQEYSIVLKSPSHVLQHQEELQGLHQLTPMNGMKEQAAKKEETKEPCSNESKAGSGEEVDGGGGQIQKSEVQNGLLTVKTSVGEDRISLYQIVVERRDIQADNVHDLGLGFKVTGGVKCPSCKKLHAVITSVSENSPNPVIKEGMSVKEWNGKNLENCSYEEVKSFLMRCVQSGATTVELVIKKCRGNFVTRPRDDGSRVAMLGTWQSMRRAKRPDLRTISKRQKPRSQSSSESMDAGKSRSALEVTDTRPSPPAASVSPASSSPRSSPHLRRANVPKPLSRSPSPGLEAPPKAGSTSPRNEGEAVVSIPRLDSNAKELSVRPRSPIVTEDGHFSRFANGMVQLSMLYNSKLEDLQIMLCKVKGQSNKEIGDSSDVFINTYLIPDTRDQGVRSMCVNKTTPSGEGMAGGRTFSVEESHSYILKEDELEETAVRLILWDATKSKKTIFRGEVLLSLSDSNVISLTGQPTWFTVCPLDPNLPALPKPVHYKQRQQRNALSRLVQRAQAITSTAGSSLRQSVTLSEGFQQASTAVDLVKSESSGSRFSPKRTRKTKSGHFDDRHLLGMLDDASVDNVLSNRHTINEAKLAKLNSIISVLKQSVDEDNSTLTSAEEDRKRESMPDFISIFKKEQQEKEEASEATQLSPARQGKGKKDKGKRKSRQPQTMLRSVKENRVDVGHFSDSDDVPGSASLTLNKKSLAWLASRRTEPELAQIDPTESFHPIPTLRESLHAGKLNKTGVTNYKFESTSEARPASTGESLDGKNSGGEKQMDSQVHYKLVDTKSNGEDKEEGEKERESRTSNSPRPPSLTATQAVSSPDCKCYPVPVEVSVHRISVIDVDRQQQVKQDVCRTRSVDVRPVGGLSNEEKSTINTRTVLARLENIERGDFSSSRVLRRPSSSSSKKRKLRSRSLGDMELLSSDEEVLLVRTPYTNQRSSQTDRPGTPEDSLGQKTSTDFLQPSAVNYDDQGSPNYPEASSSLDTALLRRQKQQHKAADETSSLQPMVVVKRVKVQRTRNALSDRDDTGEGNDLDHDSWVLRHAHSKRDEAKLLKHRSLDDLIESSMNGKKSSKSSWKQNYLYDQGPLPGSPKAKEAALNGDISSTSIVGSAKLQIEYNDLNPQSPVLLVKLLDILLQSSKSLSSELVLKCYLLHSSTGVCILKNKAVVNIKNPLPSAPLGILHFQTDFTNLTLELAFLSLGKLFSGKKEIGRVSLDLNSLELSRDSAFLEWVPIMKQVVV